MKLMKRLGHVTEYVTLRIAAFIFMCLPLPLFYRLVRLLGYAAFDILRIRRKVTLDNLRTALGDRYNEEALVKTARRAYGNIAISFAEIAIYPRLKSRIGDMVNLDEFQLLRDVYKTGHGVIVTTCHYGSWEFAANTIADQMPIVAVGKTQSNPYVDRFLVGRRAFMGIRTVARGVQLKYLVQELRKGGVVFLVSDQDAGRRGIYVPLFGIPASTPAGAAQLALRYGVPIVTVACERTGDGRYRMLVRDLPVQDNDTVKTLTARINEVIETIICRHPEQYFWMHKRWKTRPPERSGTGDMKKLVKTGSES